MFQALFEKESKEGNDLQQQQQHPPKQQQRRQQQGARKAADSRGRTAGTAAGAALQPLTDKALLVVQLELTKAGISISPSKLVVRNK